jgi:predicted lipoprotein
LPFARSGLSARYIASGVTSTAALYEAMELGRSVPKDKAWMPKWISAAFERLGRDAPVAVEGLARAKDNPDRARELRMVRFHIEGIRKLIGREIAPAAGLTIGFNELDGD